MRVLKSSMGLGSSWTSEPRVVLAMTADGIVTRYPKKLFKLRTTYCGKRIFYAEVHRSVRVLVIFVWECLVGDIGTARSCSWPHLSPAVPGGRKHSRR